MRFCKTVLNATTTRELVIFRFGTLALLPSEVHKIFIDEIALLFYYPLQHWKGGDPKAYEFKSQ